MMNSKSTVSTTRKIGDVFVSVTIVASHYAPDGKSIKLAEQAAAIDVVVAALPGEAIPDTYGEPGGVVQFNKLTPPDIAPPPATALVDAEVTDAELSTPTAV